VCIDIDMAAAWRAEPADTVAFVATTGGDGTIASRSCPNINFFERRKSADAYRAVHVELVGTVLTLSDAVARGRLVFEGLLD
jgi:Alkylmercury lyase